MNKIILLSLLNINMIQGFETESNVQEGLNQSVEWYDDKEALASIIASDTRQTTPSVPSESVVNQYVTNEYHSQVDIPRTSLVRLEDGGLLYTNTKGEEQKITDTYVEDTDSGPILHGFDEKGSPISIPLIGVQQTEQTYTPMFTITDKTVSIPYVNQDGSTGHYILFRGHDGALHTSYPVEYENGGFYTEREAKKYPIPHIVNIGSLGSYIVFDDENGEQKTYPVLFEQGGYYVYNEDGDAINPIAHMDQTDGGLYMKFVGDDQSLQTTYPMRFENGGFYVTDPAAPTDTLPVPYVKSDTLYWSEDGDAKNAPLLRLVKDGNDYKLQMGVDGHADANITLENLRVVDGVLQYHTDSWKPFTFAKFIDGELVIEQEDGSDPVRAAIVQVAANGELFYGSSLSAGKELWRVNDDGDALIKGDGTNSRKDFVQLDKAKHEITQGDTTEQLMQLDTTAHKITQGTSTEQLMYVKDGVLYGNDAQGTEVPLYRVVVNPIGKPAGTYLQNLSAPANSALANTASEYTTLFQQVVSDATFASNVLTLTKNNDPDSTVKVPVPFVEADAATGYTLKVPNANGTEPASIPIPDLIKFGDSADAKTITTVTYDVGTGKMIYGFKDGTTAKTTDHAPVKYVQDVEQTAGVDTTAHKLTIATRNPDGSFNTSDKTITTPDKYVKTVTQGTGASSNTYTFTPATGSTTTLTLPNDYVSGGSYANGQITLTKPNNQPITLDVPNVTLVDTTNSTEKTLTVQTSTGQNQVTISPPATWNTASVIKDITFDAISKKMKYTFSSNQTPVTVPVFCGIGNGSNANDAIATVEHTSNNLVFKNENGAQVLSVPIPQSSGPAEYIKSVDFDAAKKILSITNTTNGTDTTTPINLTDSHYASGITTFTKNQGTALAPALTTTTIDTVAREIRMNQGATTSTLNLKSKVEYVPVTKYLAGSYPAITNGTILSGMKGPTYITLRVLYNNTVYVIDTIGVQYGDSNGYYNFNYPTGSNPVARCGLAPSNTHSMTAYATNALRINSTQNVIKITANNLTYSANLYSDIGINIYREGDASMSLTDMNNVVRTVPTSNNFVSIEPYDPNNPTKISFILSNGRRCTVTGVAD